MSYEEKRNFHRSFVRPNFGDITRRTIGEIKKAAKLAADARGHEAFLLGGKELERISMWEKRDQNFGTYATRWEKFWSRLSIAWTEWRFIPLVDQQTMVVGHFGLVRANQLLFVDDGAHGRLGQSMEDLWAQGPLFVGTEQYYKEDNRKNYKRAVPETHTWAGFGIKEYAVQTDIHGEVTALEHVGTHQAENIKSVGVTLPGYASIAKALLRVGAKVLITQGPKAIRTITRSSPPKPRANAQSNNPPTAGAPPRARIGDAPAHDQTNRWFARSLPQGGRLHMSRGTVDIGGLERTIKRNRRQGRKQIVLSGTHGGKRAPDPNGPPMNTDGPPMKGQMDWKESPQKVPGTRHMDDVADGRDFLREDIKVIGKNGHSDIQVLDITRMSEKELKNVLTGGHDVYAGWCESACSVAINRVFESVTK